jgi:hypothetical protein
MLESVVREVLLGRRFHGLVFDHGVLDFLTDQFLKHDFNVSFIRRGLQVLAQQLSLHIYRPAPVPFRWPMLRFGQCADGHHECRRFSSALLAVASGDVHHDAGPEASLASLLCVLGCGMT